MEFLPYAKQSIDASDIEAVSLALQAPIITRGSNVEDFERKIANYCGAQYAVAFNSGTSAIMAACRAVNVSSFDRIISTPNTFISSVGSAIQYGARPLLVDINLGSGNLDLEKLKDILSAPHSRGRSIIMPVHFSGIAVDMEALSNQIKEQDAIVIEDACHALGSTYKDGQKVGCCTWSDMTIFSFHPAKIITTGEGGMVTTNDSELYRLLKLHRNNGIERNLQDEQNFFPGYYKIKQFGNNYNFTEFQAALGQSQLMRLDAFIVKRRKLVSQYRQRLDKFGELVLFSDYWDARTAFHLFVVQIDFNALKKLRKMVMADLQNRGIGTQVHYIPVYRHPAYVAQFGDQSSRYPCMERYYAQALSLPLYPELCDSDIDRIVEGLYSVLHR